MAEKNYSYNTKSIHVSDEIHKYLKIISYNTRRTIQHVINDACINYIENNNELLKKKELFTNFEKVEIELLDHDGQD